MNIDYATTILRLRAKLNLSQMALANLLCVSYTSINRWENGKYEPTRMVKERIKIICEENNVNLEVRLESNNENK